MRKLLLFLLFLGWASSALIAQNLPSAIQWSVPESITQYPQAKLAYEDARTMLDSAARGLSAAGGTPIRILISPDAFTPRPPDTVSGGVPVLPLPDESFQWECLSTHRGISLELTAKSPAGVAHGLYALLQDGLGFQFPHPRITIIPTLTDWPLTPGWRLAGQPRFGARGFHLHTQHPLELTEQLMQVNRRQYPQAWQDLQEYIDWLARNGQNTFQYYLLSTIRPAHEWGAMMARMVDYAHSRGIRCGLKMGFASIQQYAYKLGNTPGKIKRRLRELFRPYRGGVINWDYLSPDLSRAEFFGGLGKKSARLEAYTIRELAEYGAKFMYNTHVIDNHEVGFGDAQADNPHLPEPNRAGELSPQTGVLVHSVMAYALTDTLAPVYGNQNFEFMRQLALRHVPVHETWYFPESAYWITYDNSVPMFLMPYLTARHTDIMQCDADNFHGHVTFSSGWEWGHWWIDWSIARWSWALSVGGNNVATHPTQYIDSLYASAAIRHQFRAALAEQDTYLRGQNLLRLLCAQTVTDELPRRFAKPFGPAPAYRYKDVWKRGALTLLDSIERFDIAPLHAFARLSQHRADSLAAAIAPEIASLSASHPSRLFLEELLDAQRIMALRAEHRALTLQHLVSERRRKLAHEPRLGNRGNEMDSARAIRAQAAVITNRQATRYRYPAQLLTQKRRSATTYQYGYLYSAHRLHFWSREENQVARKRFGFMHRNMWPILRIAGLWGRRGH